MKTNTNKFWTVGAMIVMLLSLVIAMEISISSAHANAFAGTSNLFFSVATSTAETVGTSNIDILATSTGRTWARIANDSANPITCIYANGAPATVTHGFIISASSTFTMNQLSEPVYTGAINCISDTASAASIWVEANQ